MFFYRVSIFSWCKLTKLYLNEQSRMQTVSTNKNDLVLFHFSIKINKCSGSCDNINNPHAKLCVPDTVKKLKR